MSTTKKLSCYNCGASFQASFHQTRYCSLECKREANLIFSRIRKAKYRTSASVTLQKIEWAPQLYLSEEQEKQALQIAQYCTKSALRYCKLLLIKL